MYANRKNQIFHVAIDLFAEKTYTHCSMREIAAGVGIKVSSIYNHYPCKEDILQDVLRYYGANYNKYRLTPVEIEHLSIEGLADRLLDGLFFVLSPGEESALLAKIARIVSGLKFDHREAAKRYLVCMFEEPTQYVRGVLRECVRLGKLAPFDCDMIAYLLVAAMSRAFDESQLGSAAPHMPQIRRWAKETLRAHAIPSPI